MSVADAHALQAPVVTSWCGQPLQGPSGQPAPAWLKIERISAVLSEPPTAALPPGRGLGAFVAAGGVAAKAFGAAPTLGVMPLGVAFETGFAGFDVVNVGAPPGRAGFGATPGIAWLADGRTV